MRQLAEVSVAVRAKCHLGVHVHGHMADSVGYRDQRQMAFAQVNDHMVQVRAKGCKTIGSAYVGAAQLDALHQHPDADDQVEQAEQQRQGDRAEAGAGAQHHAERDGGQPAQDEHRPGSGRLAGSEGGGELDEAGDDRLQFRSIPSLEIEGASGSCPRDAGGGALVS